MIKVKCTDGTIYLGGSFAAALHYVKSFPGARFDSVNKMWLLPFSWREVAQHAPVPADLPSGEHQTRYGNRYGDEWSKYQRVLEQKARIERATIREVDNLERQVARKLVDAGIPEQTAIKVAAWIRSGNFEEMIEQGLIAFSSPQREGAVREIASWFYREVEQLVQKELALIADVEAQLT